MSQVSPDIDSGATCADPVVRDHRSGAVAVRTESTTRRSGTRRVARGVMPAGRERPVWHTDVRVPGGTRRDNGGPRTIALQASLSSASMCAMARRALLPEPPLADRGGARQIMGSPWIGECAVCRDHRQGSGVGGVWAQAGVCRNSKAAPVRRNSQSQRPMRRPKTLVSWTSVPHRARAWGIGSRNRGAQRAEMAAVNGRQADGGVAENRGAPSKRGNAGARGFRQCGCGARLRVD